MSYLPPSKFGNCCQCNAVDTNVVKVGKETYCLNCHRNNKAKVQVQKATVRQKVRSLINYEKSEGILDSVQELILDLDRVVSRYVRLAAMGKDHKVECFTCNTKKDWKIIQCGHFIARQHLSVRWELANMKPQCPFCNITLHGNLDEYTKRLNMEHKGITDYLQEQAREVAKPTRDELKMLLFDFQQKLKTVETKLK